MNLANEITSRINDKDETNTVVGTEIKSQRLRKNMTLKETASNVCSVSYLCKIERSDINPNPEVVHKICDRIQISDVELKVLYNLNDIFETMEKSIYYDDLDEIKNIFNKVSSLENYKANIIKLNYYVYFDMLDEAISINNKLNLLTASMNSRDLIAYAIASAILNKKCNENKEACRILKSAINSAYITEYEKGIAYTALCDIYYIANSKRFLPTALKTLSVHNKLMSHDKYDYIMFLEFKYFLMNEMYDELELLKDKFNNSRYHHTIRFLEDAYKYKTKKPESYKGLSKFYYYIALFFQDNKRFYLIEKDYISLNDYESLYIKYLEVLSRNSDDSYPVLMNELFPTALKINATYLVERIAKLLVKRLCKDARYKQAYEVLNKTFNQTKEFDTL
jgi:transcriptional regulator with XRE-family HTH domain